MPIQCSLKTVHIWIYCLLLYKYINHLSNWYDKKHYHVLVLFPIYIHPKKHKTVLQSKAFQMNSVLSCWVEKKKIQRTYQSSYSEVHFYRDKNVKINLGRSVMEHNRYYQSTKLNQVRFNPNISSYHPTKHITCSIMAIKCAKTFATGFNVMKGWSLFSNYNTMKSQLQDPLFICGKRRNQSSNFVAKLTFSSELIYDENMTIV